MEGGFIVPDDFYDDDLRLTQFCVSQSIIVAASERAKTLQWDCIPEENCILDKETLSWITADDETENLPDVRSAKRLKLEDRKPLQEANRFGPYTCSDQQLKNFSEGFVPDNTKANTEWSVCVFNEWAAWRRTARADDAVPRNILFSCDAVALNKWLSLFIVEARKKDGSRYPSKTLTLLLWKAKEKTPLDSDAPWFTMQPVGRNVLATMVKKMCESVGKQIIVSELLELRGCSKGMFPKNWTSELRGLADV